MFSFGIIAENFEVFENYIFDCISEGEWFLRSVIIVVRHLDRFLGHDVCLW